MAVSMIRTALGVSHNKTAISSWNIQAGMQVCANATLLVHITYDPGSLTNVAWNGNALTRDVSALNTGNVEGTIWSFFSNPTSGSGTLTASWTGVNITAKAAAATQVTGINAFVSGVANTSNAVSQASGGSTGTIPTTHYITAALGTELLSTTAVYTWSADITTTGQRDGTSGGAAATNQTIQEGFSISQAPATRSARATGVTTNDLALLMAVYTNNDVVAISAAQLQWQAQEPVPLPQILQVVPAQMAWQAPAVRAANDTPVAAVPTKEDWRWSRQKALFTALEFKYGTTMILTRRLNLPPHPQSFTIGAWFKVTTSTVDALQTLIAVNTAGGGIFYENSSGLLYVSDGGSLTALRVVSLNEWHHIIWSSSSGAGGIVAYLDGTLAAVVNGSTGTNMTSIVLSGSSTTHFDGLLSGLKIWNVPLSAQEMMREIGQHQPANTAGLISYLVPRAYDGWAVRDDADAAGGWVPVTVVRVVVDAPPVPRRVYNPRRAAVRILAREAVPPAFEVAVQPAWMQWQAQVPQIDKFATASPAQMQWQAQALALMRSFLAQPAQLKWQAQDLLLTRTITCAPALMQWQTSTVAITRTIETAPAQMQWQAQTFAQIYTLQVESAQMQWAAQTAPQTRAVATQPAKLQWQAARVTMPAQVYPAYLQWQAQVPAQTRTILAQPAQMQWQAQTLAQTRASTVTPAQMPWQAQVLALESPLVIGSVLVYQPRRAGGSRSGRSHAMRLFTNDDFLQRATGAMPSLDRWTWMAWVLFIENNVNEAEAIFDRGGADANTISLLRSDGNLQLGNWTDPTYVIGSSSIQNNTWHHICLVRTSNTEATLYLNGVVELINIDLQSPALDAITIGSFFQDASYNTRGMFDSIKLWDNVALTASEIQTEMRQKLPALRHGIWAFWYDASGADWSGENHHITTMGNVTTEEGPPIPWTLEKPFYMFLPPVSTVLVDTTLTVSPARMQWRPQPPQAPRTILAAQMQWQASNLALTRVVMCTPAQMQWYAQATVHTRTALAQPAQMLWQAQTPRIVSVSTLLPAQMQWQPQATMHTRTVNVAPARMQWQAVAVPATGGVARQTMLVPFVATRGRSQTLRGAEIHDGGSGAVEFVGSGGGLTGTANLPPIISCTIMAWVRLGENTAFTPVLTYGPATGASYYSVGCAADGVSLSLYNGLSGPITGSIIGKGVWRHIALVVEAPARIVAFLDGVEDLERTDDPAAVGEAINIGTSPDGIFFQGAVASIKIYGRGLSPDELQLEMRYANPVSRDGLLGWLPFRDGAVGLAGRDYSGYKADMAVAGVPVLAPGPALRWHPFYRQYLLIPIEHVVDVSVGETVQTVMPAQLQWQANTPAVMRTISATPASMQWQAQILAQARTITSTPARVQWQAQETSQAGAIRAQAARMQWRTQLLQIPRVVLVTRMQWQAQTLRTRSGLVVQPAFLYWQAQASLRARVYYPFRQQVWRRWRY